MPNSGLVDDWKCGLSLVLCVFLVLNRGETTSTLMTSEDAQD